MDLLRKYLMPLYETADPPAPPVDPAAALDPAADPDALVADPNPDASPAPSPRMVPQDVFVREVAPLRAKNRELEAERDQARREAREARELADRLARPAGDQPAPAPRADAPAPVADQDVETRAAQLVFMRDARSVSEVGARTFGPEWVETVNVLEAFGINNGEFVSAVMDVDRSRTHEIMHAIAKDPEKAAALAAMTPNQRVSEITRISMGMTAKTDAPPAPAPKPAAPPAKNVSRAPAPPPPVDPGAAKVVDGYADEASDEEFTRQFNERMKLRAAQGRR